MLKNSQSASHQAVSLLSLINDFSFFFNFVVSIVQPCNQGK